MDEKEIVQAHLKVRVSGLLTQIRDLEEQRKELDRKLLGKRAELAALQDALVK